MIALSYLLKRLPSLKFYNSCSNTYMVVHIDSQHSRTFHTKLMKLEKVCFTLCILETPLTGTIAKSENPDEI